MAKQLTDDEQNLRRKARRRLIGAFALTLAVVVLLPMVLDSEPKPTGQDIDLRIPAADEAGEFVPSVAASEVAEALPLAGSAAAAVPAPAPLAAPGKEPVAASNPKAEVPGKAQPAANETAKSKAADKQVSAVAEGYVAQVGAYSNADTAKQELDKLKKWGFKAYTEKAGDKIRVRVGPYPDRDKAEKARKLLEKHGLYPVVIGLK